MARPDWLTPQLMSRLEALELSVRWVRTGTKLGGRFPVNRRGSSIEFSDYSPYYPGDDIRAIDWNLYARLDKLFIKTYKEEITLTVELIIDATASMGSPSTEKFELAKRIALSLAYVGLMSRHRVRLSWLKPGKLEVHPWCRQGGDLMRLVEHASSVEASGHVGLSDWMHRSASMLRMRGGQAIVVTDGMMNLSEFFRSMHTLMLRRLEIKVVQVLTPQELHPSRMMRGGAVIDIETGQTHQLAYSPSELDRAIAAHNEQLVRFCKKHGILFAQYVTNEPFDTFLVNTLPAKGFLE